jgi:hypothetical protein
MLGALVTSSISKAAAGALISIKGGSGNKAINRSFAETVFGSTGWPSDFADDISNVESRNDLLIYRPRRTNDADTGEAGMKNI